MAAYEMPIKAGLPEQTFRSALDGQLFSFTFRWNDRLSMWFMDIEDADGAQVRMGNPLPMNYPITIGTREEITGLFLVTDIEGGTVEPPGLTDFGTGQRVRLYYVTA